MKDRLERLAYEIAAKDAAWSKLPVVIADTKTGSIVLISPFAASIFGYEVHELEGQPVETLVPESLRTSHSQWRKDAAAPKTRLMGVGRQIYGQRKDGTTFPALVQLTTTETMGSTIGIAFVIDLTGILEEWRK